MNADTTTTTNKTTPKAFNLGNVGTGKGAVWRGLMFSVTFKTGEMKAYPYAYVHGIIYSPSGKIEIDLGGEKLVIAGRCLGEGYEALMDHLVREIVEADMQFQTAPEGEAVIHEIKIES